MRIVILGNFGLYRKATMAARALPVALELAKRGHDVTMLLPREPASNAAVPGDDSVRVVSIGPRSADSFVAQLWIGLQMTWQVLRLRPDVLYAFKPVASAGLALLLSWLLRRIGLGTPLLALDTDDWEGKGGWSEREARSWWQRRLIAWQESWCLGRADVITVASRELERLARGDGRHIVYVPNAASPSSPGWIPGDRYAVRAARGLGPTPIILAYTRFVEFAPARLVTLLEAVRARAPSAQLLVVGKGLHGEEREFLRLVDERGLADVVHAVGWVPQSDLPAYLAAADVAAYLIDDTLLNRAKCLMKLVDLLLAGVAVVADDVGQAREYVVDGENGYLVAPGDVAAMAERIALLLGAPETRRRIGEAARSSTLTRWNWADQAALVDRAIAGARQSWMRVALRRTETMGSDHG